MQIKLLSLTMVTRFHITSCSIFVFLGEVIEVGNHDDLMKLNSHYAKLVSRQLAISESTDDAVKEVIVTKDVERIVHEQVIIEIDKIIGKSHQGSYDSL